MAPSPVLGLIAGSGELPLYFARRAKQKGFSLKTVAIRGAAPRRLETLSDKILWISVGQLGSLLSFFKKQGVQRAVMQGKVEHSQVFKNLRMDLKTLSVWVRLKDRSGEGLLKSVAAELQKRGVKLLDSRFLMEGVLTRPGWLTRNKANALEMESIAYGLTRARILAKLGVGQALVVKKKAVVAVEGMEG
ncbi:MAG TPA: UDP-2,3-diacylglucosamine diphosphatase LpxI, partial [bacterium]